MVSLFPKNFRSRCGMPHPGGGRRRARQPGSALTMVEQLEARCLLAATPFEFNTVSAEWFQTIAEPTLAAATGGSALAGVGVTLGEGDGSGGSAVSSWIVRLAPDMLEAVPDVAAAVGLFHAGPPGLRVLGGLGLPGQLLLEATEASDQVLAFLSSQHFVAAFEPDLPISLAAVSADATPNDPRFGDLYGLHNIGQSGGTADADIDAPEAWQVSTGSRDIIVGVVDTGIDYTHPDLAANIWVNPGEIAGNGIDDDGNGFVDDVHGYDFVNGDGDPFDDNGHGTHCAGTIGGVGNNGLGVAGVNWEVSLMGLKFLDAAGSGSTSDAIQAINYATMMRTQYGQNVRVTSNSWGGSGSSSAMQAAIEASAAADILFVAAAGNDGSDNDANPQYPASYISEAVVSVAATDRNDTLAGFSNYGVVSVDLAAPGAGIVSTIPGGGYASYSGTSMATPHVAGVAALALAVDPTLSVADLKAALLSTVDGVAGLAGKVLTGGRLNAGTLVASLSSEPTVPAAPGSVAASDGTTLGGIQVAWSSSLFADSYTLYRGETAEFGSATVLADGVAGTSYEDTTAAIDTVYHYWVTATNDFGTSPASTSDSGFHLPGRSPNDAFVARITLAGLTPTASGSTVDASAEAGEPVHAGVGGGKSIWWTWTAPATGAVEINTIGSGFDTVLAVYRGESVSGLSLVVDNDDIDYGVDVQSQVLFAATAGETFQIAVDGWGGESGAVALSVSLEAPEPPPAIGTITLSNATIDENLPNGTAVGQFGVETGAPTYALVAGAGDTGNSFFTIDGDTLQSSGSFNAEAQGTYSVRVQAARDGQSREAVFTITIGDVNEAPTAIGLSAQVVSENAGVGTPVGQVAVVDEDAADTHALALVAGAGSEGNGLFSIVDGVLFTAGTFDFETSPTHSVRVRATDAAGAFVEQVFSIEVGDVAEGLLIQQVAPDRDGVTVTFDGPLDLANLDLHNRAASPEDLDVTLVDAQGVLMDTALVVNATADGFRLVVNNGLLPAGDYTLTVQSGVDGVLAADGRLLDGNADGQEGDDFVTSFRVDPLPAGTAVVGVPGFFEDAGQAVGLVGTAAGGIPLVISSPGSVMSLDMEFFYDPTLLEVTGIETAAELPEGAVTMINVLSPGHAIIGFFSAQPLAAGSYEVARLLATVPATAEPGHTHLLDVSSVSLNEGLIPAVDDDGVHVVAAGNRPPTAINVSAKTVLENSPAGTLVGMLSASDPDYGDTFQFELVAGEGDVDNAAFTIAGDQLATAVSFDFETSTSRSIRVRVTDAEAESFEAVLQIDVLNQVETLHVTRLLPTVDGFRVSFSESIDSAVLNLYDALAVLGQPDLSLRGEVSGLVRGSVVVATDGMSLQFVAADVLAADSYSVTLRSGAAAFTAAVGGLLDGNADEVAGDDYTAGFTNLVPSVLVGVPSFARGAGQAINLPADSAAGVPLQLDSDGRVTTLSATLSFDPALFDVTDVIPDLGLPEGTTLTMQDLEPGRISLQLEAPVALPAGRLTLGSLQARVADTAAPGATGLIRFEAVTVDDAAAAAGRTAVQLVASLGDTSGDGGYSTADSTLAARLAMRFDTGFVAYPTTLPELVADVSGNGVVSMLDAAMIAGVTGGQQGPEALQATPPTQMLLRHDGVSRIADVVDLGGVLSTQESDLLTASRDSAESRAQAFAELAAGWMASSGSLEGGESALLFAELGGDKADGGDGLFVDPGLA